MSDTLRRWLFIGVFLYVAMAGADILFTLGGIAGEPALEGNPLIRRMMEWLGPELGLLVQKSVICLICLWIAVRGERAVRVDAPWIYKVPATPWARAWMRKKNRSWIAFIPLYLAAIGQGTAASSWVLLKIWE